MLMIYMVGMQGVDAMKILVNRALCSGHARCASVAPDLFRLNDDGYIDIDSFDVTPADEERAARGARSCPERALKVAATKPDPQSGK